MLIFLPIMLCCSAQNFTLLCSIYYAHVKDLSLKSDCSIRVYIPIMLALCLMLLATYYAQNYAGIIGWSLPVGPFCYAAVLIIRYI